MSKIPSKRNRRNPLFVDLVNALEINIDFVHSIGDRFPELAESIKAVDPQELEEERRDLSLCVEDILRDPGFGDSLAQWVEAYLPPMIIVDGNYHLSFDLESRPSGPDKPTYIQEWIAWEIYTTFQKKTLYHLEKVLVLPKDICCWEH